MAEQQVTYTGPDSIQLRKREMDLEAGWLGRLFGSARTAPFNIGGFVIVVLVVAFVVVLFREGLGVAGEFLKLVGPLITLILGYAFGRRSDGA